MSETAEKGRCKLIRAFNRMNMVYTFSMWASSHPVIIKHNVLVPMHECIKVMTDCIEVLVCNDNGDVYGINTNNIFITLLL